MAGFFDETYYLNHKVAQLTKAGQMGPDGKPYTAETVKAAIAGLGISVEDHYNQFGRGEQLNPNPYFNEHEYLTAKKALLAESDPSWATKSIDDVRAAMAEAGMTPAEHYEKIGAFESNSKGELLNPSNAFDANAYFAAKLVELQAAGEPGAENMTVQQVIEAFKATGFSPVSHYEACGAGEATTSGTPLVQTVPSAQRVTTDPNRVDNVPGNYNPPTTGAASPDAVPAPVVKPADMGAKVPASVSPTVVPPSKPLLVPGDEGYTPPPSTLVDSNDKPVVPPSDATNGNWAQVNPDGSADLVSPDGKPGGTLPGGSLNPADPSNPVPDTPAPKPDPNPGGGGGGGSGPEYVKDITVHDDDNAVTLSAAQVSSHGEGIHLTGGPSSASASVTVIIAATDNGKAPAADNLATNFSSVPIFGDKLKANAVKIVLAADTTAADQTINLTLQDTAIGSKTSSTFDNTSGFSAVKNDGTLSAAGAYAYNMDLTSKGDSVLQMAAGRIQIDTLTIKGTGTLWLDNLTAQELQKTTGPAFDASGYTGDLTMEVFANRNANGTGIDLSRASGIDTLVLGTNNLDAGTQVEVNVGTMVYDSSNALLIDGSSFNNNSLKITGGTGNDTIKGGSLADEIDGGSGNDYINGGADNDILTGGDGSDFLVGGRAKDTMYAGENTGASGNVAGTDTLSGGNAVFLTAFNGQTDSAKYLGDTAFNMVKEANILEGHGEDDTLVASTAKDVFLYQTGGRGTARDEELNLTDLGADTIYGFDLAADKILFMDQDSGGPNGVWGNGREFSAGWKFDTKLATTGALHTGTLQVYKQAATITSNLLFGFGTDTYDTVKGISNLAVYIQTGATASGDTLITITKDIISGASQGGVLTITLNEFNSTAWDAADAADAVVDVTAIASLFGADTFTSA